MGLYQKEGTILHTTYIHMHACIDVYNNQLEQDIRLYPFLGSMLKGGFVWKLGTSIITPSFVQHSFLGDVAQVDVGF